MAGVVHVGKVSRYLDVDAAARLGDEDTLFELAPAATIPFHRTAHLTSRTTTNIQLRDDMTLGDSRDGVHSINHRRRGIATKAQRKRKDSSTTRSCTHGDLINSVSWESLRHNAQDAVDSST